MRITVAILLAAVPIFLFAAIGPPGLKAQGLFYANGLLPPVPIPADNPQTDPKIRLGAQLYFDTRLSSDNTISCASCHNPDHGWADPNPTSEGVGHARGTRNAPTILNSAYNRFQFWDGRAKSLEDQSLGPIQNPVEMGMTMPMAISRIKAIPRYVEQFQRVFGDEPGDQNIAWAIAAFERTVVSTNSSYDRYLLGDRYALSPADKRGLRIFQGKGHCSACHSGPNFEDGRFHNLGVGYRDGEYTDMGRYNVTKNPEDMGAFKTPGLRSVALTAPYLDDGSEPTLESAVEFYNKGGITNPHLDPKMMPLNLTQREKADLIEFLKSLTGEPLKIEQPELPK